MNDTETLTRNDIPKPKRRMSFKGKESLKRNLEKARAAKASRAAKAAADKRGHSEGMKDNETLTFPAIVHLLIWNTYARVAGYHAFAPQSITGRDDSEGNYWEVTAREDAIYITQHVRKRQIDAAWANLHAADTRIPNLMAREAALREAMENAPDDQKEKVAAEHERTLDLLREIVESREMSRKQIEEAVRKDYKIPLASLEAMALYGIEPEAYELSTPHRNAVMPLQNIAALGIGSPQREIPRPPEEELFIAAHKDEWPFNIYPDRAANETRHSTGMKG